MDALTPLTFVIDWLSHIQNVNVRRYRRNWLSMSGMRKYSPPFWCSDSCSMRDYVRVINFRIIRPPDIVCRRTYILPVFLLSFFLSSFFLSSFFRRLISEIAEQNSTKIGHMVGSKCNLQTHVRNLGCPLPLQIGTPKHLFWTTSQLNGKFNGLFVLIIWANS